MVVCDDSGKQCDRIQPQIAQLRNLCAVVNSQEPPIRPGDVPAPVGSSHAECKLPREIAELRLGDSVETVLAKHKNFEFHEFPLYKTEVVTSMQMRELAGTNPFAWHGVQLRKMVLRFARNKLYHIHCVIDGGKIGTGISDKFKEKYGECQVKDRPLYDKGEIEGTHEFYEDSDTLWTIVPSALSLK